MVDFFFHFLPILCLTLVKIIFLRQRQCARWFGLAYLSICLDDLICNVSSLQKTEAETQTYIAFWINSHFWHNIIKLHIPLAYTPAIAYRDDFLFKAVFINCAALDRGLRNECDAGLRDERLEERTMLAISS